MNGHPFIDHQQARMRHEERLSRGLDAYLALRVREEQAAERAATRGARRLLDRLIGRERMRAHQARGAA